MQPDQANRHLPDVTLARLTAECSQMHSQGMWRKHCRWCQLASSAAVQVNAFCDSMSCSLKSQKCTVNFTCEQDSSFPVCCRVLSNIQRMHCCHSKVWHNTSGVDDYIVLPMSTYVSIRPATAPGTLGIHAKTNMKPYDIITIQYNTPWELKPCPVQDQRAS